MKKISATEFAKRANMHTIEVIRLIEKGKITAIKTTVEKPVYEINPSELQKVK